MSKTDLTNQRQVFVEEYVRSGDHLEAAKKAGYKDTHTLRNQACKPTSNTLTFTTFNESPVLWTSLNHSDGNSYDVDNTCTTIISSSSSFTLSSGTKYWLGFEYSSTPTSISFADMKTNSINSSTDLRHSANGTSWEKSPIYSTASGSCDFSSKSYNKAFQLYIAE